MNKGTVSFSIKSLDKMFMKISFAMTRSLFGEEGMAPIHTWVLKYLYDHRGQEVFQKDVERDFHIARSSVTNIVQFLEKEGYIDRVSCKRDCRLKSLTLTDKGLNFYNSIESVFDNIEKEMKKEISAEELEIFLRVSQQIHRNLDGLYKTYGKSLSLEYGKDVTL